MARTEHEVFIIESLDLDDEKEQRFEGQILADILRLGGKNPIYYYLRTEQELRRILELFDESQYGYLHLSCHGDRKSIATTFNANIEFQELGAILKPHLNRRHLFVSSCDVVNDRFAREIMPSGCLSIIGPTEEVTFDEATVLWASLYHLAFLWGKQSMSRKDLAGILKDFAPLLALEVAYYGATKSKKGYRRRTFGTTA
ncbi:MAG: hypothetical protein F4X98_15000 [Gammaproteobacteria bacterium]|nr:hypothetical protein [Gammaproteobacteria bacterium]